MKRLNLLFFLVMVLGLVSVARSEIINTLPGNSQIFSFGEPDTATYGQTITVGADNVLQSFTFQLTQQSGNPVNFQAYVMGWNDGTSRAAGPVLYASGPQTTTGGLETFTFNTGNLLLNSGSQYVLFLNLSNNYDGFGDAASMSSISNVDAYAGGLFVFLNNGNNFGLVTSNSWTRNWQGTGFDTAFQAVLVPSPEPASLLAWGLLTGIGLVGYRLRRRRAA